MEHKFNLFDLFGHFTPGAVAAMLGIWMIAYATGWDIPEASISAIVACIPLCFSLGMIIHQFSRLLPFLKNRDEHWILIKDGKLFHKAQMAILVNNIQRMFHVEGLDVVPQDSSKDSWAKAFNCCYAYVAQQDLDGYAENFNALNAMCRSLAIVFFSFGAAWTALFVRAASRHCGHARHDWCLAAISVAVSVLSTWIMYKGFRSFGTNFARTVYQQYFVSLATPSVVHRKTDE